MSGKNSHQNGMVAEFVGIAERLYKMFKVSRLNILRVPLHRFVGLSVLLQFVAALILFLVDFSLYLKSFLWFTLSFCGLWQSVSAGYYFRHETPKKADPGFMSMGDVGRLSWFFVCENIFFSLLLFFQNVYYHPSWYIPSKTANEERAASSTTASIMLLFAIEALFVFLPYLWRPLFPKTALRDSHKSREKNTDPKNIDFYAKNTYIIKAFYNFAKHYIGFFLNYVRFFDRVVMFGSDHFTIYGIEILSTYMSTGAIFIHTLVFKKIITNKQGAMLYQAGYPGTFYLYYRISATVILGNLDLAFCSTFGMLLNFVSMKAYHTYQAALCVFFYVWRSCLAEATTDNNLFRGENYPLFRKVLHRRVEADPVSAFGIFVLCAVFIAGAHKIPKVAKAYNPFYPLAEQFKKHRPHVEDDKVGVIGYTNGEFR